MLRQLPGRLLRLFVLVFAILACAFGTPAFAQTDLLHVKKTDGSTVLKTQDNGAFLVVGEFDSGTAPASGAGLRIMWDVRTGAFRAGRVSGSQWDAVNLGSFSTAMGSDVTATGLWSVALGYNLVASGNYSFAGGDNNTASGVRAFVFGTGSTASGGGAVALGTGITASGDYSAAIGYGTEASGVHSVALGWNASTNGHAGSFIFGDYNSTATTTVTGQNQFVVRAQGGAIFSDMVTSINGGFTFPDGTIQTSAAVNTSESASIARIEVGDLIATDTIYTSASGIRFSDGTVQTTKAGITANSNGAVDVSDPDGFVATGTAYSGNLAATGAGVRMLWYPRKYAFRAGLVSGTQWDDGNIGEGSMAFGSDAKASGQNSIVLGSSSTASGTSSIALGPQNTASGLQSFVAGSGNQATGRWNIVLGTDNIGSGDYSTAMGKAASTDGKAGAFVYGDNSFVLDYVKPTGDNQFVVRAAGGTKFFSNATLTAGVELAAGGGAWASVSDVARKHLFKHISGELVLEKIRAMPIREWSYKSQDPSIRHLGPTAQDFFGAFGLGESDKTITTIDIDGVNLLAAQALEQRTTHLQNENAKLKIEIDELRKDRTAMQQRLDRIEAMLLAAGKQNQP